MIQLHFGRIIHILKRISTETRKIRSREPIYAGFWFYDSISNQLVWLIHSKPIFTPFDSSEARYFAYFFLSSSESIPVLIDFSTFKLKETKTAKMLLVWRKRQSVWKVNWAFETHAYLFGQNSDNERKVRLSECGHWALHEHRNSRFSNQYPMLMRRKLF